MKLTEHQREFLRDIAKEHPEGRRWRVEFRENSQKAFDETINPCLKAGLIEMNDDDGLPKDGGARMGWPPRAAFVAITKLGRAALKSGRTSE